MKHLYLIGGPMGVGKTTVCQQLKQALPYSVFLDGDWCWDASPFQVTPETRAMVLDNICHLLNNFLACTAYQNVVFCWVLHQQDIWDTILGRLHLEGCAVHCVALTASEAALRQRLEADARLPLYAALSARNIDTTGKTPAEVAAEIAQFGQTP